MIRPLVTNDGETKSFNVPPGEHTLRLKIDWASSQTIAFTSTDNQALRFSCQSALQGAKLFFAIFILIFTPHKYINLQQIPRTEDRINDTATPNTIASEYIVLFGAALAVGGLVLLVALSMNKLPRHKSRWQFAAALITIGILIFLFGKASA